MRVKISTILSGIFIVILILEVNFFNLFPAMTIALQNFNTTFNKTLVAVLSLCSFALSKRYYRNKVKIKWLDRYYCLLILFLFLHFIYAAINYNMTLFDFLTETRFYFIQFLIYPLIVLCCIQYGIERISETINLIIGINGFLIMVQAFINNVGGMWFLSGYDRKYDMLYGVSTRIFASCLIAYVLIYNFYQLIDRRNKFCLLLYRAFLVLECLILLFFVHQTRSNMIAVVLVLVYMVLIKRGTSGKKMLLIILGIVIACMVIHDGIIGKFLSTFSSGDIRYLSTQTRIKEIQYFIGKLIENPILGIGVIRDNHSEFMSIKYGPTGNYYYNDIGIIGTAALYGLVGLAVYCYLLYHAFLKSSFTSKNSEYYLLMNGINMYVLITLGMLEYNDPQRALLLVLFVAISCYCKNCLAFEKDVLVHKFQNNR